MDITTEELTAVINQSIATAFDTRDTQLTDLRSQLAVANDSVNGMGGYKAQLEGLRTALSAEEADFAAKLSEKQSALDAALTANSLNLANQQVGCDAAVNDMQTQRDVALAKLAQVLTDAQ